MKLKVILFALVPPLFSIQVHAQSKAAAVLEVPSKSKTVWEERIASGTKAVFTRDVSRPDFGVAFRDSNGMIWSALLRDEKGNVRIFDHQAAAARACREAGGRLATRADISILLDLLGLRTSAFSSLTAKGLEVISDFNSVPVILGDSPESIMGFPHWWTFHPQEIYKNGGMWRFREVSLTGNTQSWPARCVAREIRAQ